MSTCMSHKPRKPFRTLERALRAVGFSTAAAFVGLSAAGSPAWANASLQAGQVWSGSYRCAAISGRASLEVTRFEPIAERPGWQRIEATLTIEESGRRGVARFAANNPTRSDTFLLGLREWVEQPAGVEVQRLRLQPMRDAGGVARIGVNVHGRPDCIVNGVDTFAFMAEPARPDRAAQARSADTVPAGRVGTVPTHTVPAVSAPHDLLPAPAGIDARASRTDVPCTPRNVVQTEPGLPEADPAQWRRLMPILHAWGTKHYRFTGPGCTVEWSFVVRQWQAVAGHPVTGVLTAADLQAVARAVEQSGRSAAAAEARTPAPAGATGSPVEVFGIQLGAPLTWPRCQNNAWTDEPRNRPCVDIKSWGAYFMFDRSTEPAMLFWGIGGERMGYLIDGRLERMTFRIYREDEHLQAFEQKFGTPKKELVPMHNDQGGRWTGFIHRWDVAGTSIQLDCTRFERVCSVEIETPVWRSQRQQDKDRRQKL